MSGREFGSDALLEMLAGVPLAGRERSMKISRAGLLTDRLLLGFLATPAAWSRFVELARAFSMPSAWEAQVAALLRQSDHLHVGLETDGARRWCKVYLEFNRNLAAARRQARPPGVPLLLYLAFKWDTARPREGGISRYFCHVDLPPADMLERVQRIHGVSPSPVCDMVCSALQAGAGKASPPMYLEVREDGNPRSSYDINLYGSGLRLVDVAPRLQAVAGSLGLGRELTSFLGPLGERRLGHLSAGRDRHGDEFLSVYYPMDDANDARVRDVH